MYVGCLPLVLGLLELELQGIVSYLTKVLGIKLRFCGSMAHALNLITTSPVFIALILLFFFKFGWPFFFYQKTFCFHPYVGQLCSW